MRKKNNLTFTTITLKKKLWNRWKAHCDQSYSNPTKLLAAFIEDRLTDTDGPNGGQLRDE